MGSYTEKQIGKALADHGLGPAYIDKILKHLDTPEQSEFVKKYSQRGVVSIYDSPPILEEFKRIEAQLIEAEIKRQIEKLRCELQDPPGHEDFKDID